MMRLPNIDFTKEEMSKIIARNPIVGGEAYVCQSNNPSTIYKILSFEVSLASILKPPY